MQFAQGSAIMQIELYDYQKEAIKKLQSGSILCGGVGSGKSLTSLFFYKDKICRNFQIIKDLYIITTAKKRDSLEWDKDLSNLGLSKNPECSIYGIKVVIDSWNNIKKYENASNAFFIFDEQRLVGHGAWTKHFLKIAKNNEWILLSATPGDTWMDYVTVFIANGFYKTRSEFIRRHVVYSRYSKFPKVEKYLDCKYLSWLKDRVLVYMDYSKKTKTKITKIKCAYDKSLYSNTIKNLWNPYKDKPLKNIVELCITLRRIVNQDNSRINALLNIYQKHKKIIVFYNFNCELDILEKALKERNIPFSQWNGRKHEEIPNSSKWVYLVNYSAGAEGWNCIETNAIYFYSLNHSYKMMKQASGRIDRVNTKFEDLYYYYAFSDSTIDKSILKCLANKKTFNAKDFIPSSQEKHML